MREGVQCDVDGKKKVLGELIVGVFAWFAMAFLIAVLTYSDDGTSEVALFSEEEYVVSLELTDVTELHDVVETASGYEIIGEDAYVVYSVEELSSIRGVRVEFSDEFADFGSVQVFVAGEYAAFRAKRSSTAALTESTADLSLSAKSVCYVRIDVNMPEGTVYELSGLYADIYADPSGIDVLDFLQNPCLILYAAATAVVLLLCGMNRRTHFLKQEKSRDRLLLLCGWIAMLLVTYGFLLQGEYIISPSNMMYSFLPWAGSSTSVSGPLLSDPIDSFLPRIYETYYGTGYSAWESRIGFGIAISIDTVMYPFNWFYLLPLKWAILLKSIFEFSMAYFGMCYLLKRLKLSSVPRVVGGVSYALSSAMVMWHFWAHTDVMMLAPLILGLGNKLAEERKLRDMFLMAIVTYLMLIAGMPTYAAYVIYLLGFYIVFHPLALYKKDWKKSLHVWILFAGSIILGVICALPYLQTLLSTVGSNGYLDLRASYGTATLPFSYLRTVILPYERDGLSYNTTEATLYAGIAALLFLAFAGIRYRYKKQTFWVISWVVLFLFVFTHILDFIFIRMPEINTSLKFRVAALLVLVTIVLAMISFEDILQNREWYRARWIRFLPYAVILVVAAWMFVQFPTSRWAQCTLIAAVALIVFVELILKNRQTVSQIAQLAMVVIVVINMGVFAQAYLPLIDSDAEIIPEATDTITYLQDNTDSERIYVIGDWALFPNTNVFYDLSSLSSHALINTNADIQNYLEAIDDEMAASATAYHGSKVDNYNLLRYAGVKYIVLAPTYSDAEIDEAELVYTGEDFLEVYELDSYNARFYLTEQVIYLDSEEEVFMAMEEEYMSYTAFVVGSEADYANTELSGEEFFVILEDEGDDVTLSVSVEEARLLVFNEYNDGNWKVYVDGEEAELETVNYLFKGVRVGAGEHIVEFVYDDGRTDILLIAAGISMGVTVAGLIGTEVGRRREKKRLAE